MGTSLSYADLTGANLTQGRLGQWWQTSPRASLQRTTLSEADVSWGQPTDTRWYTRRITLDHAILREADLTGADLRPYRSE